MHRWEILNILKKLAPSLSHVQFFCNPMDCSPPGSSVYGIFQARIPEWVAISYSRVSFSPKDRTRVSYIAGRLFTIWAIKETLKRWYGRACLLPAQHVLISNVSSVAQLCPTLCDPMDCSTSGFPVHHQLTEFTQTHVHWVGDAIQPFHPLSSPSPPAFNLSQHQGLFKWVGSSHQVAKILEFQLQHQSFQWILSTDFL